jgi:DNA invertase Pin-like site-specific DNA recombinase
LNIVGVSEDLSGASRPSGGGPVAPAVAAYIRVSSRAQDLDTQRAAIERAAAARGDVIGHWFAEKRSAKTLARPELTRLRAAALRGELSRLYVFRLDRLARSGIRDTFEVVEELRTARVELVSVADGFALTGPAAEVVLAVMAWASKMERLAINERVAAARDRLEAEGRPWGRPPRLTDAQRVRVAALRSEGRTVREIAVALKLPRSTVGRALSQNPAPAPTPEPPGTSIASRG